MSLKTRKSNKLSNSLINKKKSKKKLLNNKFKTLKNSKFKSYAPSINANIKSLSSTSPDAEVFNCNNDDQIQINKKCYHWKTLEAQKAMLKNAHTKSNIKCYEIIPPTQRNANCWFNSFFMIFFISDKGRKFFRYLRDTMIRGIKPNNQPILKELRESFFLMNKYIDSFLLGERNKLNYAERIDTNKIIKAISDANLKLDPNSKMPLGIPEYIFKVGQAGNPLLYYQNILKLLGYNAINMKNFYNKHPKVILNILNKNKNKKPPHILVLEYNDSRPLFTIPSTITSNKITWKLDSSVLRDTSRQHFSAYITCNKNEYAFDGYALKKFIPFKWKKNINIDTFWKIDTRLKIDFNFKKGYHLLFYYRV